jgi:hypothetical protein
MAGQGRQRVTRLVLAMTLVLSLTVATAARAAPGLLGPEQVDSHALNTVSCSAPSHCATGGRDLVVQDHAVRSDLSGQLSPSTEKITAISCASGTNFCAVTDDSGGTYTLSGETLSARSQLAGVGHGFDAVSCPTSSFCMAIDDTGNTFKYSGGTWSSVATVGSLATATSGLQVSCVSEAFCVAALPGSGSDEDYSEYNGSNWSPPALLQAKVAEETGLSCTSKTFCVGSDAADHTEIFSGSAWAASQPHTELTTTSDQFSVSCSGTFCLADSPEEGSTFLSSDGTTWSPGPSLTGAAAGGPVSCASSTMCAIVSASGFADTYALPDTLATQPSLAGSATLGATISLTSGTTANPEASVSDVFQRCLGACMTLPGRSYMTTAADAGASFQALESSGIGLDTQGPFATNTIGPISGPAIAGGVPGGGTSPPPPVGGTSPHPLAATVGTAKVSGTSAQVTVSCPVGSSTSCPVKVVLAVTEKLSGGKVVGVSARQRATTRKVTLGTASATLQPGAHRQLAVSLNVAGKQLLTARHILKVDLSVTQNDAPPATRHIEFQAARKKHK